MRVRFFLRKATAVTLASELQRLERRARESRAASGYSSTRSLLAARSRVSEQALGDWIDDGHTPRHGDDLMKVVRVLADWAGEAQPAEPEWQELWLAARAGAPPGRGATAQKAKPGSVRRSRWRMAVLWVAGAVATALVSGFFTPIGADVRGLFGSAAPASSRQAPQAESLQASARWCCQLTTLTDSRSGYYWPGTAGSLDAAFSLGDGGTETTAGLTPAGAGLIEIPLQTSGSEPIYVAAPQVVVRSRKQNIRHGIVAVMPPVPPPQGSAAPSDFEADVDDPTPATSGTGPARSQYYYVSSASPEDLILAVTDTHYDCTFDIRLTWQAQGRMHSALFTNGGRHFRIFGSSGLPWYSGDPMSGQKLAAVGGRPFSAYAP